MEKKNIKSSKSSPVCWFYSEITQCSDVNALNASQQDLFYYLMYMGRLTYENAWEEIKRIVGEESKEESEKADYSDFHRARNYKWIYRAYQYGLLSFDVELSEIATILDRDKHSRIIDDLEVINNMQITLKKVWENNKYRSHPFKISISGTERKKVVHVSISPENAERFFRNDFYNDRMGEKQRLCFVGFKLWHMTQLTTKYSKTLFRLVVQWQKSGQTPEYKDIVRLFGLPENVQTSAIMTRYVQPACDEVGRLLDGQIAPNPHYDTTAGRKLVGIKFNFTPKIYSTLEKNEKSLTITKTIDNFEYTMPDIPTNYEEIGLYMARGVIEIRMLGLNRFSMYWLKDYSNRPLPEPVPMMMDISRDDMRNLLDYAEEYEALPFL